MAKNRWELEENRKKKAQEAALAAIKATLNENPAQRFERVQGQINSALQQQSSSRGSGGFSGGSGSSSGSSSGKSSGTNFVSSGRSHGKTSGSSGGTTQRANTTTTTPASQQQSSFGLQGLQNLPIFGAGNVSSAGSSLHRVGSTTREDYLAGGAARRRTNIDSRTGTNTSRGAQREEDEKNLQLNMARWHMTDDKAERDRLHQANNAIRARLGLAYDNGTTYDPRTGRNYSLPTDLLFSGTAAQRARLASQYPLSREAHGLDWDTPSIYPSMQQIVEAGSAEAARGTSAREALQDLYTRSEETWTEQDTKTRDRAEEALEDEMSEILSRYGLHYRRGLLDMGGWSEETATDATATDLLRRAGANEQTIRYVENNIEQRQAADRLGQGVEAVVKRAVGSIPALFETAQQQSENVEQSRQNPEYVQLEAEEQQLENQLTGMPSTNYDGTLNQEYMDVYNRLQQVRERKGQLAVQTPVDQSKWGQTMLREAGEAQANATAGLSRVPRLLANTGISIAGNAPGMAASLIPGFGPAIGAGLMATQTAGQRAQELSARGVSPSEALGRGVVSGLIEAVTEKLPIDHLSNILHSGGIDAVRNFLRQMGIEATEESASYVMNFAADWAANDPDAQFSFAELVDQALGGALSGGFYATVGTVGGKALAGPQAAQTDVQQGQAGQRPFWQAEPVTGDVEAAAAVQQAEQTAAPVQQVSTPANTAFSYRYTNRKSPMSDFGHAMFVDDEYSSEMYGREGAHRYTVDQNHLRDISDFYDEIAQKITEQYENGTLPLEIDSIIEGGTSADDIARSFNPDDIVMSADAWDNGDLTQWFYENIAEPNDIYGFKTNDGAIVFDENMIAREDNPARYMDATAAVEQADSHAIPEPQEQAAPVVKEAQQADSQALGRRLAELDEELRAAEGMLPGPARDARIDEIRTKIRIASAPADRQTTMRDFQAQRQAQAARDFAAIGEPIEEAVQAAPAAQTAQTPETIRTQAAAETQAEQLALEQESQPAASVPVTEAIQYGKTPEQAMQEAAVRAQGEARQAAAQSERAETVSTLMQAWQDKRAAEKQAEQTREGLTLTQHDIDMAQNAARTGVDSQKWENADNPEKAMLYGKTLRAVREADQPIRQYFAQRAAALQSEAQSAADAIATFAKDKRTGFSYQRETMERNIRDIFGKEHQAEAEAIIREYITPVHEAVAEGNRLKNRMRERVKKLGLNKHERALVQMRLEAEDGAAAEYIKNNKIKVTPKMDAKIDRAVQEFRSIYNELYNQINQTLLLNGQEPAPFRQNYAPHFVKNKPDTLLGRVRFALGLGKDSNLEVPTDIAGLTDTFRPGKKWFGNLLQREGEITDYDAVAGFDQYIETAADVITLTESIQKLRALEDQVRYTLSDEGVKARIDAIRADPELDALQQRQKIEEVYDDNRSNAQQLIDDLRNQKRMGMGRFVTELRRYTDNLAGKKSREDRGWEDMVNRQFYTVAKNLEGRVAANMISLNPGSWLTNVIPITQATGEVSVPNLVRGMFQTVRAHGKDDGYRDASAFLTNRYGSERLDRSIGRRVSDLSGAPMELIDHFTANTIHRAKYAQNIDQGMSMDEAIADADAYTAGLMADRSKGALPTVFNATNPIRKVFTMFQVEVNNQLSYLFKDMPKAQREKGVAAVAWAYTKVFTTAYLFNLAYSQLTGRDAALDPIGIIADALGVGEEDDEERTGWDVAADIAVDVTENLPFVGGLLGGGRVPIQSAFPNPLTIWNSLSSEAAPEKKWQTVGKELTKPLTYLVPKFGGGAIRRVIEGYATVDAGGSYTYDNDGNRILQFPVYGMDPLDYAQAMIFGKWSSEEAQEYINSGFKGLSAKETAAFDKLRREMGVDGHDAMEAVLSLRGFESVKDAEGNTQLGVKEQQRLALFDNDKLTPEQKAAIDQILLVSGEDELPADYTDRNAFLLGQYVSESRQDAAREAISHGLDIDQFVSWDDRLRELQNEKDANDERVRTDAAGLEMALDEVMQDSALSDSEKQAIADYVLISSMSDKQREDWETGGRGNVNASDFVRWTSRVSQLENEKDAADEKVRTAAEARNMVLDELAAAAIDDETRQKIAEYVIIPTMGEADAKKREDWANIAKGHVNATDFIRFQDDLTIYKDWAKGSETDNARNVAEILRGYDGISDEQRDILFQTYTETMASNPFHVSSYEQQIEGNQFYQDLSEDGRLALRALTNEYEQAVNEGKELDSWLAKAYMANAEANITPGVYALYRVALQAVNAQVDNNGNYSQAEAQAAVESLPGLSQHQKAYLWQSTNKSWKNNPYGSATVGEYSSGMEVGINPIAGGVVTSFFGPRKSFQTDNGAWASSLHPSIDIGAAEGTPIGAYKSGTVIQNGWVSGYGWTIEVEHGDGTVSAYHHMMQQSPVAVGTAVSQGQQIGQVGQTGNSKGPHLDLTITRDGTPIDPATLIPELEGSASGYIYEGTVSSGAVSSGAATARAAKASSGGSSGSSGLKKLEGLSGLKSLF